jgi:hypothetical protein
MTLIIGTCEDLLKLTDPVEFNKKYPNIKSDVTPGKFELSVIESGRKYFMKTTIESQLSRINRVWLAFSVFLQVLLIVPVILYPERIKRLCNQVRTGVEPVTFLFDKLVLLRLCRLNEFSLDMAKAIDALPYAEFSLEALENGALKKYLAPVISLS